MEEFNIYCRGLQAVKDLENLDLTWSEYQALQDIRKRTEMRLEDIEDNHILIV